MNRAVHRLHGGVRQERHLVDRVDLGDGARHRLVDIAGVLRHRAHLEGGLLELGHDLPRVELGVARRPIRSSAPPALLRGTHVVGDDRNGIIEPHHLAHALDRLGRGIVDALHATAEHRRLRERRSLRRAGGRRCHTSPCR